MLLPLSFLATPEDRSTSLSYSGKWNIFLTSGEGVGVDHLTLEVLKIGFFVRALGLMGD